MNSTGDSSKTLTLLANRINDMRNPAFPDEMAGAADLEFHRFTELFNELNKAGIIQVVANPGNGAPYGIMLTGYPPGYSKKINEFLLLSGFSMPTEKNREILIPVYSGIKKREVDGIAISTRSTYDLIQILRAAVEIPQEHIDTGLAVASPLMGAAGENIHIHVSKDEPDDAVVTVKYRGYWFFISETDMPSKLFYKMARTLWSITIDAAADHNAAPLLTIPVGR